MRGGSKLIHEFSGGKREGKRGRVVVVGGVVAAVGVAVDGRNSVVVVGATTGYFGVNPLTSL